MKNGNPTPTRIVKTIGNEIQSKEKENAPNPINYGIEEDNMKDSTLEWVHRQSDKNGEIQEVNSGRPLWSDEVEVMEDQTGTKTSAGMEENMSNKQGKAAGVKNPSSTVNPNLLKTRVDDSQQPNNQQSNVPAGGASGESKERNPSGKSAEDDLAKKQANVTVNSKGAVEVLSTVEGGPVEVSGDDQLENVSTKVMQENMRVMEKNSEALSKATMNDTHGIEHAIVLKNTGVIEALPMACASGTGEPTQIQINIPLQSPNQILHDIIIHNVIPVDIQNAMVEQR
ncbi:hypothetical protein A4A49_29779 [Nicotiana attenuata]|uniref:Uncharacterized protein n=1 Tax=Nicotiana attenuata TaxID=49451 RepID=A0A1J6KI66_NICAT|nr:hypothetical protein A4A49_29779 [Nicotiana attenuata]